MPIIPPVRDNIRRFVRLGVAVTIVSALALGCVARPPVSRSPAAPTSGAPASSGEPRSVAPSGSVPATEMTVLGYGAGSVGGRGGTGIVVSTLEDSGPGSLRDALEAADPRIVRFDVSGTIELKRPIIVSNPFLTVDGSTAPGPVELRGGAVQIRTHDVILRYLRLRPGDTVEAPTDEDALTINGLSETESYNIVVDHVTAIWGPDIGGIAILGDVHDVTVQHSILGEGLYLSRHAEGTETLRGHSMGVSVFQLDARTWPKRITFVNNLITTSDQRMPAIHGGRCVDVINNVFYNWGKYAGHGNPRSASIVGNWYRAGPELVTTAIWNASRNKTLPSLFEGRVYVADNHADGFTATLAGPDRAFADAPLCPLSVSPSPVDAIYPGVLDDVGATLPSRDAIDDRIIQAVSDQTGEFFNGVDHPHPNPY